MGFLRFRQTFKIVPGVRLNLSRSGASVSLGPRGLHFTIGPRGTRTTVGLPGSGVSWTAYQPYSSGKNPPLPSSPTRDPRAGIYEPTNSDANATIIDSAPIEQLVANSTVDIAAALNESKSRWRSYKVLLTVLSALFVVGAVTTIGSVSAVSPIAAFIATAGAVIIIGATAVHGRKSSA